MSHLPKGGSDSSHRSEVVWRLRGSDEKKKGSHGVRGEKKGKREETKEKTTAASRALNTKKKSHWTKWIYKCTTGLCSAHTVCLTERNKRWRKMKNIRVFSSAHFSTLVSHTPKSLWVFLPLGSWKHLTLLTSLPERAWVQRRQRDSTMRENWREKDESSRKREQFYATKTGTFRGAESMVPNQSCVATEFVQQNQPAYVS